eukprot:320510_1
MDAQEITFNQDPEANATEIDTLTDKNNNNELPGYCAACGPCRLLYWYISPLCCGLCHSLKCFIFHPLNFGMALLLIIFDTTMLSLGVGIIPLCCMGIPLIWISMELIVAFSRIDLALHSNFAEDGKNIDKNKEHLLTLSLYFTELPLCCCYNGEYRNCMDLMFERMKYLFTSIEIYKYILYHIIIKPIIAFTTWSVIFFVIANICAIGIPIWYEIDDTYFVNNQVHFGWAPSCHLHDNNIIKCDKDYIFIINTFSRALAVGLISLFILPLTLRFNNYLAYLNKIVAYRAYTFYYTDDIRKINDKKPILVMIHDEIHDDI